MKNCSRQIRQLWASGSSVVRDRSLFIVAGGGGGFGAKQCEILADPPFECYFTEVIPPNNIWWLSRSPPHVFILQANLSGPPLNPSKVFSDSPLWVLSLQLIPPFVSLKIK